MHETMCIRSQAADFAMRPAVGDTACAITSPRTPLYLLEKTLLIATGWRPLTSAAGENGGVRLALEVWKGRLGGLYLSRAASCSPCHHAIWYSIPSYLKYAFFRSALVLRCHGMFEHG